MKNEKRSYSSIPSGRKGEFKELVEKEIELLKGSIACLEELSKPYKDAIKIWKQVLNDEIPISFGVRATESASKHTQELLDWTEKLKGD